MTTITTTYEGELHCRSVHGPSGAELATDAPTDNQGRGEAFSPTDLVATALTTCLLTVMGIVAAREGFALGPCRARVEKTMSGSGVRRIAQLEVWIELAADLDPQQRQRLRQAGESCPVKASLEGAIPMVLHWQ